MIATHTVRISMDTYREMAERIAEALARREPGWARAHAERRPEGNTAMLLRLVTEALRDAGARRNVDVALCLHPEPPVCRRCGTEIVNLRALPPEDK